MFQNFFKPKMLESIQHDKFELKHEIINSGYFRLFCEAKIKDIMLQFGMTNR